MTLFFQGEDSGIVAVDYSKVLSIQLKRKVIRITYEVEVVSVVDIFYVVEEEAIEEFHNFFEALESGKNVYSFENLFKN